MPPRTIARKRAQRTSTSPTGDVPDNKRTRTYDDPTVGSTTLPGITNVEGTGSELPQHSCSDSVETTSTLSRPSSTPPALAFDETTFRATESSGIASKASSSSSAPPSSIPIATQLHQIAPTSISSSSAHPSSKPLALKARRITPTPTSSSSARPPSNPPAPKTQATLDEHVVAEARRSEPANLPAWVPSTLSSRVHKFADFSDPDGLRFAIARIPTHANWGSDCRGIDTSRYLCIDDQSIDIWLPAVVVSKWFVDYQGNLQSPIKLSFNLLRDVDKATAQRCLSMTKPHSLNDDEVFWASRLMLEWPEDLNVERPEAVPFTKIFDATTKYCAHDNLEPLTSRFVNVGDVVLVEARLTRYKQKNSKRTGGWQSWATAFELQAVSVVARCPPRERGPTAIPKRAQAAVDI